MAMVRLVLIALLALSPLLAGGEAQAAWTLHAPVAAHDPVTAERVAQGASNRHCCTDRTERNGSTCHVDNAVPRDETRPFPGSSGGSYCVPIGSIPEGAAPTIPVEPPRSA